MKIPTIPLPDLQALRAHLDSGRAAGWLKDQLNELRELVRKNPQLAGVVYRLVHPEHHPLNRLLWRVDSTLPGLIEWPELRAARRIVRNGGDPEQPPQKSERVLVVNLLHGGHNAGVEVVLSKALRLHGGRVEMLVGDLELRGTEELGFYTRAKGSFQERFARIFSVPVHRLSGWLSADDLAQAEREVPSVDHLQELIDFRGDGLPLGELVRITYRWSIRRHSLPDDEQNRKLYRDLVVDALALSRAYRRMLQQLRPQRLLLFSGLFFTERVLIEVARSMGIPFVTWEGGWIARTLVARRDGFAGYCEQDDVWSEVRGVPLQPEEDRRLDEFLAPRWEGRMEVARYWPTIEKERARIAQQLQLDPALPTYTLFSNILWDSSIQERDIGFQDMMDWIGQTIRLFDGRREQLVIRIHPAEIRLVGKRSHERVLEELLRRFPELPSNVRIVPSESRVSSYELMTMSRAILVYTSTAGLEAAIRGIPVVVTAQTHYRGKGFTLDAETPEQYRALLERLMAADEQQDDVAGEQTVALARRYAYLLFFRHMIPFPFVTPSSQWRPELLFDSLHALVPGADRRLDLLCDSLLGQGSFVLPRVEEER